MNATTRTILALALIGVITVSSVLIVNRLSGRARVADLTEQDLYTLSKGTRSILEKINQPITLKLYYSRVAARKQPDQIRFWNSYFLYVRDLLDEFVDVAGGKLKLEVIDPRPYSDEEDEALKHGVRQFPLADEESFFFGLVAASELGKEKVIDFFEPGRQDFVEYDIAKLVTELVQREKRKVGVLSSMAVTGMDMSPYMMQMLRMQGREPERPWTLVEHLRTSYDVVKVEIDNAAVPSDVDFLMVVHPKDLDEDTLFAIDQYVMRGGKLAVFQDPYCIADQMPRDPQNPMAGMNYKGTSNLNSLLEKWGVKMDPDAIAVDRSLATKVQLPGESRPTPFWPYLSLTEEQANKDEVVSAGLHTMQMLFAGALTKTGAEGTRVKPLIETTEVGCTWTPTSPFELQMPDQKKISEAVVEGTGPVMLACIVTGKFRSNFPDGIAMPETGEKAPQTAEDAEEEKEEEKEEKKEETSETPKRREALKESAEGAVVLVVADVDMLTDRMAYQETWVGKVPTGNNASLVLNMLDFLSGSTDLISIRTRGRYSRPFKVVEKIEREEAKASDEEVAALSDKMEKFQEELKKLGGSGEKAPRVIQGEVLEKRRRIETEIRETEKALKTLKAKRREKVEALESEVRMWNLVAAPLIIAVIAVVLLILRWTRARYYAARRD